MQVQHKQYNAEEVDRYWYNDKKSSISWILKNKKFFESARKLKKTDSLFWRVIDRSRLLVRNKNNSFVDILDDTFEIYDKKKIFKKWITRSETDYIKEVSIFRRKYPLIDMINYWNMKTLEDYKLIIDYVEMIDSNS